MLVASGNDPKTVQERMGHVDIETTLNFYAMTTEEARRRATGAIVQFFAQGKTPKHKLTVSSERPRNKGCSVVVP